MHTNVVNTGFKVSVQIYYALLKGASAQVPYLMPSRPKGLKWKYFRVLPEGKKTIACIMSPHQWIH